MLHGKKLAQQAEKIAKETFSDNSTGLNLPSINLERSSLQLSMNIIDLVVISSPTRTHYEMANYFLKTTNVLIEKPLALKLKEVFKLEKISKRTKKKLFVDYPFIFSGSIEYIRNVIKKNTYGKLIEIESFREQAPIRKDANVVWDLGVHDISILRYLLNKNPKKINSLKYNTIKTPQKDTAYINLDYQNNLKVFVKNSWISPLKIRIIKFKFERGIIICDENEPIYKLKVFTRKNSSSPIYKLELPEINLSEPLLNLINYVAKSLKENTNPIFNKNFNIDITKVLEKI